MYKPKFNTLLVEIDDKDAQWGGGNDDSMLGKSYSKGKIVDMSDELLTTQSYPLDTETLEGFAEILRKEVVGKQILWNEGAEAGTLFEEDGKLYGFIYWWDVRGVKE